MARPQRRPLESRKRACKPAGAYASGKTARKDFVIDRLSAFNRRVHTARLGAWLRSRLERQREHPDVPVRLARAGSGIRGLRIAFVSDLHAGSFVRESDFARLCEVIARSEPDLIALGGDLVESRREEILLLGKGLSLLAAPLGIFAVPGNHDHYADPGLGLWSQVLEAHGVRVLCNRGLRIEHGGDSFWLGGVDDLGRGDPDLPAAVIGARENEPVVLLSHHPDFFVESASAGVDLTLAGHTHGGQITFRGRTPFRHSEMGWWRGHYEVEGAQLYVGRGAGTTLLPLRVHAPAEVPFLRLEGHD